MKILQRQLLTVSALALVMCFGVTANALEVGDSAPCVVLDGVDAQGKEVSGCIRDAVSASHKFTIIDFFSINCSTCKANLPAVAQLATDVNAVATVRYVSVDRNADQVKAFIKEHKAHLNLPVAFDTDRDAKTAYGVRSTPTMFILERLGAGNYKIVYKHGGALNAADLTHIKQLVGAE